MRLPRAEGFLYTKHPVRRPALPITGDSISDDGATFGYAYTARPLGRATHRATPAEVLNATAWTLVSGYAYTARYEPADNEQSSSTPTHHNRIGRIAA